MKATLKFALLSFLMVITACKKDKKINYDSFEIKAESAAEPLKDFDLSQRMAYYKVPGVSIAVVNNGRLEWAKGYGIANSEKGIQVDTETLFQAGSISKPLAAIAALQLVEAGKLALTKDVNIYLKNWTIEENEFTKDEKVTLERLLTHTAGTTVHGFPGYRQNETFPTIDAVLSGQGNTDVVMVDKIPGSSWRYSGGGYTIIEKIIEDVSGLPLEKYMDENVLGPIGMTNSTYEQPLAANRQTKASAAYTNKGVIIEGYWHNYPEQAAAGLWTTPSDLAKYCIEIQEILSGKKDGVLSEGVVELMLTKHKNNWGLGPFLAREGNSLTFGHGGKNAGFTNNLVAFAHKGRAVVIMTNGDNGGDLINEIQKSIFDAYNW